MVVDVENVRRTLVVVVLVVVYMVLMWQDMWTCAHCEYMGSWPGVWSLGF